MLSNDLLKILTCPVCKETLQPDEVKHVLQCQLCGLEFPVKDGIPILLVDDV
ncbi:MAG: Trm112 family protein [Desulfuromonadaceae bacterium]|nr:Trm112 family protein [Desulfuromonadaceae bacterium]